MRAVVFGGHRSRGSGGAHIRLSERDVERQLVDYLRLHGWHVHRIESDVWRSKRSAAREEPGTPDFICARLGNRPQVFYLEVKRPGGRLRHTQRVWIDSATERGWTVIVADGIESLARQMQRAGLGGNNP